MPETVLAVARRHKAALLARDAVTLQRLSEYYGLIYEQMQTSLSALITRESNTDDLVRAEYLAGRRVRLETILAQVQAQMDRFAAFAEGEVKGAQGQAVASAAADTAEMLARRSTATITGSFSFLPVRQIEQIVGFLADGSPLGPVIASYGNEAVAGIRQALVTGIAEGKGPAHIAREIATISKEPLGRAMTMARTESMRVYNSSTQERYARHGVGRWQWLATLSQSSCPVCIAMHGTVHEMDDPFGSHPRCRCTLVPLWDDEDSLPIKQAGEDWWSEQSPEWQDKVLGKGAAAAVRAGDVRLIDFVRVKDDPKWGRQRSLQGLKKAKSARPG